MFVHVDENDDLTDFPKLQKSSSVRVHQILLRQIFFKTPGLFEKKIVSHFVKEMYFWREIFLCNGDKVNIAKAGVELLIPCFQGQRVDASAC